MPWVTEVRLDFECLCIPLEAPVPLVYGSLVAVWAL